MKIKMLNHETIEKIAAGEVIVRPASVVKELVENAIDAKAGKIDVTVEKGGKKRIRVVDDGIGIAYNEIPLAFTRHATSKLSEIDDLQLLDTLGFRGEALSSIAAVSRVCIRTISETEEMGSESIFEAGECINRRVCPLSKGTDIDVTDLFFNVPVRQKHMQKNKLEEDTIHDLMERMALSHPEVAFGFYNGERRIFKTPGTGHLKDVIECLYGRSFFTGLRVLNVENKPMVLRGYIGDITQTRSSRDRQILFINGRYVRSSQLSKAFEEAYEGYLMNHRYPVGIIFMTLPGRMLDINIHPAKTVVGILNESLVDILFRQGIRSVIRQLDLSVNLSKTLESVPKETPKITPNLQQERGYPGEKSEDEKQTEIQESLNQQFIKTCPVDHQMDKAIRESNRVLCSGRYEEELNHYVGERKPQGYVAKTEQNMQHRLDVKGCQIVGQLFNTYILLEKGDEILLIDQHAAHEAFRFENLMDRFANAKGYPAQTLLIPQPVDLSKKQMGSIETIKNQLLTYGFEWDIFGEDAILVRSVPIILGEPQQTEIIRLFIDYFLMDDSELKRKQTAQIAMMSCKGAVKGNQKMSENEIHVLLEDLVTLKNPFTCPHGRPIILRLKQYELEKLFKRVI